MSSESKKVIGQGTYGCIHKGSLICDTDIINGKKITYKNMVSKIMRKTEVNKELREYDKISSIDKFAEFYLGKIKPFKCRPDNSAENIASIQKCELGDEFISEMNDSDDIRMLVMSYGGITLETFADRLSNAKSTDELAKFMEGFWLETHRLLRGLKLFITHGIIHHDIKPQNIVYDIATNRLNFIDFGIVQEMTDVIRRSEDSRYKLSTHHWSLPVEMKLYNKNFFDKCLKDNNPDAVKKYLNGLNDTIYEISKYIYDSKSPLSVDYQKDMARDLKYQLSNYLPNISHSELIKTSISTIDIYGVGFTLLYVLLNTEHLIPSRLSKDLYDIFYDMVTPDLTMRYQIDELMTNYEHILEKHNIPKHFNKKLDKANNVYVNIYSEPNIRDASTFMGPPNVKMCSPNHELNPITNNCVVLCKVDSVRDVNFKCTRVNKSKSENRRHSSSHTKKRKL